MTRETEEKLAGSLTAETTELVPFLPYLLQDFWELGSDPGVMAWLIEKHVDVSAHTKVLDLGSGKGAVSVRLAQKLGVRVKGVDLLPEFVAVAAQKAEEYQVGALCEFVVGDINAAVQTERGYDVVILGAVGDVLGTPVETLCKLSQTIRSGGYILIDEGYLPDDGAQADVQYDNYEYLTKAEWEALFEAAGLDLIETVSEWENQENPDSDAGMERITRRAHELMEQYPDKKDIFEGYIRSQQAEYEDLDSNIVCVTWILKKR